MKNTNGNQITFKNFKNFEAEKLTASELHQVSGGMLALGCTCGTNSVCHVDGTTDGDCAKIILV
jgi:hypothetical protein